MNHIKSISLVTPRTGRWLAVAAVVTSMAVLGGCANRSALPLRASVTVIPASKCPEQIRTKAIRSRCRGSRGRA